MDLEIYTLGTVTLLAFIGLSAAQSSTQTCIHSAILVIDTSNNASYNHVHWSVGTPYLSIKASNAAIHQAAGSLVTGRSLYRTAPRGCFPIHDQWTFFHLQELYQTKTVNGSAGSLVNSAVKGENMENFSAIQEALASWFPTIPSFDWCNP